MGSLEVLGVTWGALREPWGGLGGSWGSLGEVQGAPWGPQGALGGALGPPRGGPERQTVTSEVKALPKTVPNLATKSL